MAAKPDDWTLSAGSDKRLNVSPGTNWGPTPGRIVSLKSPALAESLGKCGRWHVYFWGRQGYEQAWPTIKENVVAALSNTLVR